MLGELASPPLWCVRTGLVPYAEAGELQKRIEAARLAGAVPDVLLLLEHPPVYTRGRRTTADELPMGESWYRLQGIDVVDSDRGGRVTYHGPGQLVGYPIVSLRPYGDDVHGYVRRMEQVIVGSLAACGIEAGPIEGLTGVWTYQRRERRQRSQRRERRKIASIGVHVSRGITRHGFAVNVSNDLQPFEWVVPCGIDNCRMTSITRETGIEQDVERFMAVVSAEFGRVYERQPVAVTPAELELSTEAALEPAGA
jgi:lipoyl(octanoyl) transferase